MKQGFFKLLGWTMLVTSGLGFVGVVSKPPDSPFGTAFILALIAGGGVGLVWRRGGEVAALPAPVAVANGLTLESAVLKTARALKGRVTVAEVAAESGLPMAQVEAELQRMEVHNVCTSLVGESGIIVYLFTEFEDAQAKQDIFAGDEERRAAALQAGRKQST